MKIISRKEALEQNLTQYFTGNPCKRGHVSIRLINGGCVECRKLRYDKEYHKEYDKQPHRKQQNKDWYKQNKERRREYQRKYQKNNKALGSMRAMNRKAAKLQRTPLWANKENIRFFYEHCPKGYHVDHIIPLCGENISGLHIETNLQWLLAHDNQVKGNKF